MSDRHLGAAKVEASAEGFSDLIVFDSRAPSITQATNADTFQSARSLSSYGVLLMSNNPPLARGQVLGALRNAMVAA